MTRPKYIRQKEKALKHLEKAAQAALARGEISFRVPDTNKELKINFKTKDGKGIDNKFYSKFFSATYALLKMEYGQAATNKYDRKSTRVLKADPVIVTLNSMVAIYTKWDKIERAIDHEQAKLRPEPPKTTV